MIVVDSEALNNAPSSLLASSGVSIRDALNEYVRNTIWPASLGMAGLYLFFAFSHSFLLPAWSLPVMVPLSMSSAIIFLFMGIFATRKPLPSRWVHPYVSAGIGLALCNCLTHMYLLQDPYQSINIALVIMGAGIILLSTRWLLVLIAAALASWFLVVFAVSMGGFAEQWRYFGYVLVIAAVLSGVAHTGRLKAFERIERLRIADRQQQRDLEAALMAVRESEERLAHAHADLARQVSAQTLELEQANLELLREVNERRRAEADTQFLAQASASMSGSLDYSTTLAGVARHAVPYLADFCIVDLVEDGELRQSAVAHVDPSKEALVRELRHFPPHDSSLPFGVRGVLETGAPRYMPRINIDLWFAETEDYPKVQELLRVLQPFGYMIVPLRVGNTLIGTLSLVSSESQRVFEERHLRLATELAGRAALAVEHARLYAQAQEAIQARDAFVSIAAHELKSPLTALNGYAQLLHHRASQDPNADAFQRRGLQTVLAQSKRLEQLLGTMLDVSRIDNDQLALKRETVSIPKLVSGVVDDMRAMLELHTIIFEVEGTQPMDVRGDVIRLEQVFHNLLQNAVKYSPSGGTITVRVKKENDQVVVSVADTGIGIAADDLPRLFGRFFRARSAERSNIKGLGIGLYIVSEIVQRHGGTIDVQSVEWEGSTFTVRLPTTDH
jgi:signal transduction histidine kinase